MQHWFNAYWFRRNHILIYTLLHSSPPPNRTYCSSTQQKPVLIHIEALVTMPADAASPTPVAFSRSCSGTRYSQSGYEWYHLHVAMGNSTGTEVQRGVSIKSTLSEAFSTFRDGLVFMNGVQCYNPSLRITHIGGIAIWDIHPGGYGDATQYDLEFDVCAFQPDLLEYCRLCVAVHWTDICHYGQSPLYLLSNTCRLCHTGSSRLLRKYTSYHLTSMALTRDDRW